MKSINELVKASLQTRKYLIELCHKEAIHIGGDLSITDVMTVLWQYQMKYNPLNPKDPTRDRFILSKGHASAVTSFNQAAIGCFAAQEVIDEYATDGGRFSMHSCNLVNPFVEVSTGSLGHGFPIACGIAAALKLKNNNQSRVYCIMGDGELSEGSIWEAAMNAVHYKLGNLVAIVDYNGLEADGTVKEITGLENIADKFKSFGFNVREFDGNDITEIVKQFDALPPANSVTPTLFLCHTIKGKGISFMENQAKWHAGKLDDILYDKAMRELNSMEVI